MTQKKIDWARLAMAVDTEGCITIACGYYFRKDKGKYFWHHQERLTVGNTCRVLIEWIVDRFGGELYPYPKSENRQFYEWRLRGGKKKYEEILVGILPYLIIKRKQALLLLEYVRLPQTPMVEKRTVLAEKVQSLNQQGKTVETNTPKLSPRKRR